MNLSAQEITAELFTLPEQEQQAVFDFIKFLKDKSARRHTKRFLENKKNPATQQTEGERILAIVESVGLLGCMESGVSYNETTLLETQNVSPIYKAFEQAGLIGCIESDEQLSITYKDKIDFSFKLGEAE